MLAIRSEIFLSLFALLSKVTIKMSAHILDTRMLNRPGIIAAIAVETTDGLMLFDVGPESTFENISAELGKVGFNARDVRHAFLSHIHFDHAGAAWRLAELGSTIYVHPRGAPHLLDPTRLIESARRIFGDRMETLWGRFAPVPKERLRILHDNDVVLRWLAASARHRDTRTRQSSSRLPMGR